MTDSANDSRGPESSEDVPPIREYRQISILHCDLVRSTELADNLDVEKFWRVIQRYFNICRAAIKQHQGFIGRDFGDGMEAYFGYPQANETAVEHAVRAGLTILERLDEDNRQHDTEIRVRIGVSTGRVKIGAIPTEPSSTPVYAFGKVGYTCARLQDVAEPGTILVDAETRALVSPAINFDDPTTFELKGFSRPVKAWQVLGDRPVDTRLRTASLSPFVGREPELSILMNRWETARQGEGRVVLISGLPGVGKSRLIHEFEQSVAGVGSTIVRYQCSAFFTHTPLYPLLRQLERAAQFQEDDSESDKLNRLSDLFELDGKRRELVIPILARYLSIPLNGRYSMPDVTADRQLELLKFELTEQIMKLASQRPVLIVIEDTHWLDRTSKETVDALIAITESRPILILISMRPEHLAEWKPDANLLSVNRLSRTEATAMIDGLTAGKKLSPVLVENIKANSDGIPLYVEEMTKMCLSLSAEQLASGSISSIPSTLEGLVYQRLDQLGEVKELVEMAAAVGQEFEAELLQKLCQWSLDVVENGLEQLVSADFLYARLGRSSTTYVFKHALLRNAIYERFAPERRLFLHESISRVLARGSKGGTQSELMARHLTLAAEAAAKMDDSDKQAELHSKAVDHWLRSGQMAFETGATLDAAGPLEEGLEILERLPSDIANKKRELQLYLALAKALCASTGWADQHTKDVCARATALSWELRDIDAHIIALDLEFGGQYNSIELTEARRSAERMVNIGGDEKNLTGLATGLQALGMCSFVQGDFESACDYLREALTHVADKRIPAGINGFPCMSRIYLAYARFALGYQHDAESLVNEALEKVMVPKETSYNLAVTLGNACYIHQLKGDLAAMEKLSSRLIEHAEEHGFRNWEQMGVFFSCWVSLHRRPDSDTLSRFGSALEAMSSEEIEMSYFYGIAADLYMRQGEYSKADHYLTRALQQAEHKGEEFFLAELYRLRGHFILKHDPSATAAAEQFFRKAIDCARSQGARSWELNAANALVDLLNRSGRPDIDNNLLAPLQEWFTNQVQSPQHD